MGCGSSTQNNSREGSFSDPEADLPFLGSDAPSVPISADAVKPFTFGKDVDLAEVLRMRADFWESRVEGNAIIWQTLKSAAENILDGDVDLANAILEASSVSTPHGSLYRCYDELGALYSIPRYCYCNPKEMMEGKTSRSSRSEGKEQAEEGGKSGGGTAMNIRVKVAPGEIDGRIESTSGTSVRVFKEQVGAYFQQESQRESKEEEDPFAREQRGRMARITKERLRVVYLGQELEDKRTLGHYNVSEEMVVHIYLRPE